MIKNIFKHLNLINKHKWLVFKLSVKAGIPLQGLFHDLSKYSPTEFIESVKYFNGKKSPISVSKQENGYSKAWLHHKGRNKHHYEYWFDYATEDTTPIIPYKYFVEMICDSLAAGMIYQGKNWNDEYQLTYWLKTREKARINPKMDKLLTRIYTDVAKRGVDKVLDKKYLKEVYTRFTK